MAAGSRPPPSWSPLPGSTLAGVLSGRLSQWLWSIAAVAAVDLIAAGAMRADALAGRAELASQESLDRIVAELEQQRDSARADLALASQELDRLRPSPSVPAAGADPLSCSCGRLFPTRQALSGHQRWCRPQPSVAAPASLRDLPAAPLDLPGASARVAAPASLDR